jgi:hypothetical protein
MAICNILHTTFGIFYDHTGSFYVFGTFSMLVSRAKKNLATLAIRINTVAII